MEMEIDKTILLETQIADLIHSLIFVCSSQKDGNYGIKLQARNFKTEDLPKAKQYLMILTQMLN